MLITEDNLWLVGMDRNSVIVDGTKSGPPCSTAQTDQVFGSAQDPGGGLNGIMVYKAQGTWVENLTVCNFLDGSRRGTGNEIWWNGGANSGSVFVDAQGGYTGSYLTATTTYYQGEATAATYGIFSSNWNGGSWKNTYASNFNDSGYYIGACQQQCNQTVDGAWSEYNALGYSGSNSGGPLVVRGSRFDNNEDGFDTNSQNGDNPPPQDGSCPPGVQPPTLTDHNGHTFTPSTCWVFFDNSVDHNNNPNVPTFGSAGAGPAGTGLSIAGGRNDTVIDNTFSDNNAWGTILVPYPDSGDPCTGGTLVAPDSPSTPAGSGQVCWFDESGDAVVDNTYVNNGSWNNPTNGDIAATNLEPGPSDCFSGNVDTANPLGLPTTSPPAAEALFPMCSVAGGEADRPARRQRALHRRSRLRFGQHLDRRTHHGRHSLSSHDRRGHAQLSPPDRGGHAPTAGGPFARGPVVDLALEHDRGRRVHTGGHQRLVPVATGSAPVQPRAPSRPRPPGPRSGVGTRRRAQIHGHEARRPL